MEELETKPFTEVSNEEFEEAFDEIHETDDEVDDLYNAKDFVLQKIKKDEFFTMDDKKWNELVQDGIKYGIVGDTKDCAEILEDMLNWDKLLPDDIKEKVEVRFNELGDMCERGELEPEEAYNMFKEFEDKLVDDYVKKVEAEGPEKFDKNDQIEKKKDSDVLPGEGPILRWRTRVVIGPGGDSWHPKNRLVKLGVTVKELGLSKNQFRRLRELVGKRYHPGKDELLITSERFEHREENRKDCLRTLISLIEEAKKADDLADDARAAYVKGRLRANPAFMERLRAKALRLRGSKPVPA